MSFRSSRAPAGCWEAGGLTEGAIDLMRLAGLPPAAVLCELMNPDRTMAHGAQVEAFAFTHDLVCLTLDGLVGAMTSA